MKRHTFPPGRRFVGLRCSPTSLAWAVVDPDGLPVDVGWSEFELRTGVRRHDALAAEILRLDRAYGWPRAVGIERPVTRDSNAFVLGTVFGMVIATVGARWPRSETWSVAPGLARRGCGLSGRATIAERIAWAELETDRAGVTRDEADALVVAEAARRAWLGVIVR